MNKWLRGIALCVLIVTAPASVTQAAGSRPASTNPPSPVVAVWGGARFNIILLADGSVWDWGLNNCDPNPVHPLGFGPCGKLGDGSTTDRHQPVQVHGPGNVGYLGSVTAVMGNEHDNLAL